jgi:hypothetical protein
MNRPRHLVPVVAFCGTVALVAGGVASLHALGPSTTDELVTAAQNPGAAAPAVEAILFDRPRRAAATARLPLPPLVTLAALSVPEATAASPLPVTAAPMSTGEVTLLDADAPEAQFVLASVSPTAVDVEETEADGPPSPGPRAKPSPGARMKLVSLFTGEPLDEPENEQASEQVDEPVKPVVKRLEETVNECFIPDICMDDYLWAAYERTPKVDTNKLVQKIKTTVKHKGKTRTVTKTITKYVVGDFTWKDPIAAERAGMSLKDYVIGGMDKSFKQKLYYAMRAMDEAGHMPGITSAFRDDYRQSIAVGKKAASDSSFHGGSRRGGYGHGMAIDLVSVNGATRLQRFSASVELWKWVDANEKTLGVGRPYLDRDPPHIAPIDGREFIAKRGGATAKRAGPTKTARAGAHTKTAHKPAGPARTAQKLAAHAKPAPRAAGQAKPAAKPVAQTKPAPAAKPAKVSSLQARAAIQR